MKQCSRCKEVKDESLFYKRTKAWDGYSPHCKGCQTKVTQSKEYKEHAKLWLKNNPKQRENQKVCQRRHHHKNRDKRNEKTRLYRKENLEHYNNLPSQSREKKNAGFKKHYEKNKKYIIDKTNEYREKNKDRLNELKRKRIKEDPIYALRKKVSTRIRLSMCYGRFNFTKDTMKFIGCDIEFLKKYLEKQFKKGMNWQNNTKKGWHIDHKIPLSSAKTEEELIVLFHYTNLQPLWWHENLSKHNKILPIQTTMTL